MGFLMGYKDEGSHRVWVLRIGDLLRRDCAGVTRPWVHRRGRMRRDRVQVVHPPKTTPGPTTPAPTPAPIPAPQEAVRTTTRRMERQETHHSRAWPHRPCAPKPVTTLTDNP